MRTIQPIFLLAMLGVLAVPPCAIAENTPGPTDRSIGQSGAADDQPEPQPNQVLIDAVAAARRGELPAFRRDLDRKIADLLAAGDQADGRLLVYTAAADRAARRYGGSFERLTDRQKKTLDWLAHQPQLGPQFLLALDRADKPAEALTVLADLREFAGDRLDDHHELATALAVVYDKPRSAADIDPKLSRHLFMYRWFTEKRFQLDPVRMPWRLSVFTVDGVVSADEMVWAYKQYASSRSVGASYFDVPYDEDHYYTGAEKQIAKHDYTLVNLTRFGGVCEDQAYFASQVGKAVGVPSTYASGQGGAGGVGHAWVGYLAARGSRALWDFTEGRYDEHRYWSGNVTDPQTQRRLTDADVSITALLVKTPPADRLRSQALAALAAYADPAAQLETLVRAIETSPANTIAWDLLIDQTRRGDVPAAQLERIDTALQRFAAGAYPDFAYHKMHAMVLTQPEDQQLQLYEALRRTFRHRPDLVAQTRLAQGDLLVKQGDTTRARAAYLDVLRLARDAGPYVPDAVRKASLTVKHEPQRVEMYRMAWKSLMQPDTTPYAVSTPFYTVGREYAKLLRAVGDIQEANNVDRRLDSLIGKDNN